MCVDYRLLNKITIRDSYPLPLIDDCVERMEGNRFFSLFDLRSGFHHVPVAPDSVPFTSFVTPNGQYEYVRMPFGLCNAPAVLQRFINFVLRSFIDEGSVIVYIDDIALGSRTLPEHLELIRRVLRRLAGFRLELNLDKCRFCYDRIDLLGFTIDSRGICPNNQHVENIKHLPIPTNTSDLHKYITSVCFPISDDLFRLSRTLPFRCDDYFGLTFRMNLTKSVCKRSMHCAIS